MANKAKPIVIMSQQYALTITLNPKLFTLDVLTQRNQLMSVLNGLIADEKLDLSVIVEFTQSFNIHAHGFVRVPLKLSRNPIFLIHDIFRKYKSLIGFIYIKPISEYHNWLHYCLKDYHLTKVELEGENPVILNNMGDFSLADIEVQNILSNKCECEYITRSPL